MSPPGFRLLSLPQAPFRALFNVTTAPPVASMLSKSSWAA